jgi:antitoxin PrlF
MTRLTVTAKGQVTLRKDLLQHLGVEPGQKIELGKLPGGRIEVKAAKPSGSIDAFIGLLADRTNKSATLEEIDEAGKSGWAGED